MPPDSISHHRQGPEFREVVVEDREFSHCGIPYTYLLFGLESGALPPSPPRTPHPSPCFRSPIDYQLVPPFRKVTGVREVRSILSSCSWVTLSLIP